ncbi:hypothetical protein Avbf_09799, partial [Armadillidium vulgare]
MSSQRGKCEKNPRSKVCKQCKDVIEWKIKYKKYKPLTQPKTCSNCHLKSIK